MVSGFRFVAKDVPLSTTQPLYETIVQSQAERRVENHKMSQQRLQVTTATASLATALHEHEGTKAHRLTQKTIV